MGRRVGIVGADHALDLGKDSGGLLTAVGDDGQRANALAIQREGLGERAGNEEIQARLGEQAHSRCVFVDAVAEALVGDVEERHVPLGLQHVQHLQPVFLAQIDAGRVVAAGVQNHDGAGRQGIQVFQQTAAIHALAGGIVVTVVLHREAGGLEQRAVVFPARVADRNHGVRQQALEEIRTGFQCAGPANRLSGDHAAFCQQLGISAEQQLLHALVIGGNTFDRQVATRCMGFDAGLFGGLHGAQQRQAAILVVIHANPQIDLAGTGIGIERFVQSQDGVAGGHFDGGEQTHLAAALRQD
ncbi:hypothetical protein D3C81_884150 [compost metagenome]